MIVFFIILIYREKGYDKWVKNYTIYKIIAYFNQISFNKKNQLCTCLENNNNNSSNLSFIIKSNIIGKKIIATTRK